MRKLNLDLSAEEVALVIFRYSFSGSGGVEILLRKRSGETRPEGEVRRRSGGRGWMRSGTEGF